MSRLTTRHARMGAILIAATAAGCASAEAPPPARGTPPAVEAPPPQDQSFEEWRLSFRGRALAAGIRADVFDTAFAGVTPSDKVLELDSYQPEFSRPIWEYLDSAVSDSRVAKGRELAAAKRPLLDEIEARHGVDREAVLAIWGMESAFGANYGDIPVVRSLATLAWHGRRKDFAEEQLISALRILQAGDVTPARMVGSWAGAMGHTQFIPTSLEAYAVDHNGDGRRDLWSADAADALASTANYLGRFGWTFGAPAAVEVRLPAGFDYAMADADDRRPASSWAGLGVTGYDGRPLPASDGVAIIVPAGARGPAFAAYPNFRVIMRYNNATSYALAVSLLASRIEGGPGVQGAWPRDDRPLSRSERVEMQERLTGLGFDTQGADGIIGPNSRKAVRGFQAARGLTPDGYAGAELLALLRQAGG
ncbi:MAG: lytic murein transglycosylase [Pseudomonadota bacterium]|nr:lytic murein transglycosylase [Pseudomonadota bacterium]